MQRTHLVFVFAVTLFVLSLPASAQYKWRDKAGVVQYSDMPPPLGTPEKDVLAQPAAAARKNAPPAQATSALNSAASPASGVTVSAAPPKSGEPELEAKRKKVEQEEAAKAKAEGDKQTAAKADNCMRAKAYQKTLDDGIRVARTDAKGEREILDDKGRAEESRRVKNIIGSDCK